jgi:hypothetical protein
MKNIIMILFLICLQTSLFSQSTCPAKYIESKFKEKYYPLGPTLSQEYFLIGMQREALKEDDRFVTDLENSLYSSGKSLRKQEAHAFVYNAVRKNEVTILNECHNLGVNRAFFYSLLDSLQNLKIDGLFIETFAYMKDDEAYVKKNKIENWGYYTCENTFKQIAGKLEKMTIPLYSYEEGQLNEFDTIRMHKKLYVISKLDSLCEPIELDAFLSNYLYSKDDNIQREAIQAIHIYQKMIKYKMNKIFIYCGYGHAWKIDNRMAGILKHILHKDVFSIDQTFMNEHSEKRFEESLYRDFSDSSSFFVLVDDKNQPFHTVKYEESINNSIFDLIIGSPRTIYINNRPSYLELNGERKRYSLAKFIDANVLKTDFLAIVYDAEQYERNKAITLPEDVFQVKFSSKDYDLILTPNKRYRLFIIQNGATIIDKQITSNE